MDAQMESPLTATEELLANLRKASISRMDDDMDLRTTRTVSTRVFTPAHSRNSSNGSSTPSPLGSPLSSRGHSRWPSSCSSMATTPDSPVNVTKSPLHDLVEDPAERDESTCYAQAVDPLAEGFCLCDPQSCKHRPRIASHGAMPSPLTSAWRPIERYSSDDDFAYLLSTTKRKGSDDSSKENMSSRLSRRLPSISRRLRRGRATTSVTSSNVRSAPPSRSSSFKQQSVRQSLSSYLDPLRRGAASTVPASLQFEDDYRSMPFDSWPTPAMDFTIEEPIKDPVDREELSSTPLLPSVMTEFEAQKDQEFQSPLQSPTVAPASMTDSVVGTPLSSPITSGIFTPSLSRKPSFASIGMGYSKHAGYPSADILPLNAFEELDEWSIKLGHANYHVLPEPYVPESCNSNSCKRLLDDWEEARRDYLRQAARISEHYGPTSLTYKHACQKWDEIDSRWRSNFYWTKAEAEAHGESPTVQSLPVTQEVLDMPSLNDPLNPEKFPNIDEADIVGPMVQHVPKLVQTPSRKSTLLKLFTAPASVLRKS